MSDAAAVREGRLRRLASKLFFTLENKGSRYNLYRDADVSRPVHHEGLTLDEVETILQPLQTPRPEALLRGNLGSTIRHAF